MSASPLPCKHNADTVRDALIANLGALPELARLTLTWDQSSELAYHSDIATMTYGTNPVWRDSSRVTGGKAMDSPAGRIVYSAPPCRDDLFRTEGRRQGQSFFDAVAGDCDQRSGVVAPRD
jgi:hypothetical protein